MRVLANHDLIPCVAAATEAHSAAATTGGDKLPSNMASNLYWPDMVTPQAHWILMHCAKKRD